MQELTFEQVEVVSGGFFEVNSPLNSGYGSAFTVNTNDGAKDDITLTEAMTLGGGVGTIGGVLGAASAGATATAAATAGAAAGVVGATIVGVGVLTYKGATALGADKLGEYLGGKAFELLN